MGPVGADQAFETAPMRLARRRRQHRCHTLSFVLNRDSQFRLGRRTKDPAGTKTRPLNQRSANRRETTRSVSGRMREGEEILGFGSTSIIRNGGPRGAAGRASALF